MAGVGVDSLFNDSAVFGPDGAGTTTEDTAVPGVDPGEHEPEPAATPSRTPQQDDETALDPSGVGQPKDTRGQQQQTRGQQQQRDTGTGGRRDAAPAEGGRRSQYNKNAGDLIDIRSGKVVLRHGQDHKAYFKDNPDADTITRGKFDRIVEYAFRPVAQKMIADRQKIESELAVVRGQLQTAQSMNRLGEKYGLDDAKLDAAARIISVFIKNPQQAIDYLIADARKNGHAVKFDGQGSDIAAISAMLDTRLKPITDAQKQAADDERHNAEAVQRWNDFTVIQPDARVQQQVIADLMDKNPKLSLEHAYLLAKNWAHENGFDWSRPLADQLNGGADDDGVGMEDTMNSRRNPRPMPSGRRAAPVNGGEDQPIRYASPNADWRDITADTLRQFGYKV